MKIFRLQSKKSLIGWLMLIAVLIIGAILFVKYYKNSYSQRSINEKNIIANNPKPRLPHTDDPVPQTVSIAVSDRISETPNGIRYVKDEIVIILEDNISNPDQKIKEIADKYNVAILGSIPALLSYQLQFSGLTMEQLRIKAEELEKIDGVESANLEPLGGIK